MSSQEEPNIAKNDEEMVDESPEEVIQTKNGNKKEAKQKKLNKKQEQKKPIDGKQQFGDKNICRLCKVTTVSTPTIICIRCHFKYHKECIRTQNKEPQFQDGVKWHCLSCIERMAKRKLKESEPQKKKKIHQIQDFFSKATLPQEDKAKKLTEFQQKYPMYIQQGRVVFPILDEYLTAYQQLFNIEFKKKPTLILDNNIPQDVFEDVLKIWDSYNNMEKIVSEILYAEDQQNEQQSQLSNIGTLIHFRDNHQLFTQKSRVEIYNGIKNNPQELIMFFAYFYLKQIIEDLDAEQMQKQQYKIPYWHLLGYLWFTNRQRYYELLEDDIKQLPTNIYKQGILQLNDELVDFDDYFDQKKVIKLLITMVDGLESLKKTQFLLQFRTENLLSNNRMKGQLGAQIKQSRSQQIDLNKEVIEAEGNYQIAKTHLQQEGLTRVETQKLTRQMEASLKIAQKLKQQYSKLEKEISTLTERYNQQDKALAITQIPTLLLNPSMFLGYDSKNSQYYFFLFEPDKIFVCMRHSFIDEQSIQWGYYEQKEIQLLLTSLCQKGVRENQLKINIQELQRAKLLQKDEKEDENEEEIEKNEQSNEDEEIEEEEEEDEEEEMNNNNQNNNIESEENDKNIDQKVEIEKDRINSLENLDIDLLVDEFSIIEASLSDYLNKKNSRWCSSESRSQFLKGFQNVIMKKENKNYDEIELEPLCKAIEYFVDNTMMQEKLELRLEEEMPDKEQFDNNDDSLPQQQNRKRKVVEDDSSQEEQLPQQTVLQSLEQMDSTRVRVRKLPMKLFGTYYETLRLNLIDQLKYDCNLPKLKICLEVLGQIVKDYIDRKINQQQHQPQTIMQQMEKKKVEDIPQKKSISNDNQSNQESKQPNLRRRPQIKNQYTENQQKWEDRCKICGQGGKVICCDTCPRVFHPKCINLKEVPQGKWNCLHCLSNFERQVKTRATIKKLENQ